MKNENTRNEKLSEWLSKVDDDLLNEAYSVDTADKLKKRIESEKIRSKTPLVQRPAFRGAIAVAACLALTVGAVLTVPALFRSDDIIVEPRTSGSSDRTKPLQSGVTPPKTGDLPNVDLPTGNLHINSIDMLNYYSAIRVLTDSSSSSASHLSAGSQNPYRITLLSAGGATTPPYETPGAPVEQNPPTLPPSEDPDIYYYEIDPEQVFYITKVSFFQIELTDETGFLASKLGTGVVDVVISENFIYGDSLVTFKNGDRYFSCLCNGFTTDELSGRRTVDFSTHKYIEGFYVVKNFEQENYSFYISFDGDQAVGFECLRRDKGENPDGVLPVVSQTRVSNVDAEFTIAELEDYFNAGKLPEQGGQTTPDNASDVYMILISDESNFLILQDDGTFLYGNLFSSCYPREGKYEKIDGYLFLRFYENGELVEETDMLVLSSGFYYNEERFLPYNGTLLDPTGNPWSLVFMDFYSDGGSLFTLHFDGTFEYKSGIDTFEQRRGKYEITEGNLILRFYENGELVEETVNLSYSEAFNYNGEIFYPCPKDT